MIYLLWIIYWLNQGMILMSNIAVCILKTQIQFLKYCCWLSKKQPSVADIEYKRELGVAVSLIHFFKTFNYGLIIIIEPYLFRYYSWIQAIRQSCHHKITVLVSIGNGVNRENCITKKIKSENYLSTKKY